jgi:uncharacterized protein
MARRDKTPVDLTITPRDRRFGRELAQKRWWLNGDPVGSAFHNALSIIFPRGEAFFVESVKAFREGTSPKLAGEIRSFITQEVMHSREHVSFNKRVSDAGYKIDHLEQVVIDTLALTKGRPEILNLAVTMALEHYTAIMAQMMLADAKMFAGADPELADMWRWHAIEEIEHKGVAYDTWLHATRDWARGKRWRVKTIMMLIVTQRFWTKRWSGALDLLAQDGITGWNAKARLAWYLVGTPGVLRRLFLPWAAFFLPGFHPWNHDDRALIGKYDSDYAAANLQAPALAA